MRGQVVAQPHRLRPLPVGVPGEHQAAVRLRPVEQRPGQPADARDRLVAGVLGPQTHRGLHLVVAAAAGVDARAEIAEQPLDRRVHVLVGSVGLDLDPLQRLADPLRQLLLDQPLAGEHPHVHGARPQVVGQQPPVDGEATR